MWGTIGGAVSGGVGAATGSLASSSASSIMKNPLAKSALENAADTAVGTIDDLAHGRDVSIGSIAMDFGTGMVSSNNDLKTASHTILYFVINVSLAFFLYFKTKRDVFSYCHMREKRVFLENSVQISLVCRHICDVL